MKYYEKFSKKESKQEPAVDKLTEIISKLTQKITDMEEKQNQILENQAQQEKIVQKPAEPTKKDPKTNKTPNSGNIN